MPTPGGPYSGIWKLKDLSKYIQDNAWPEILLLSGDIALFGGISGNSIEYVQITTTGNSADFGDLNSLDFSIGCASSTRALFSGDNSSGAAGPYTNVIDYVPNILVGSNAVDFGDATQGHNQGVGGNSSTRGILACGVTGTSPSTSITNTIDYVTSYHR